MMRKKWNIILTAVLLAFASIFMTACQDADVNKEQIDSTEDVVSDEPIEYDTDYAEDDETAEEDSSEEVVGGHEEDIANDEADDIETIQEEDSE